MQSMLIQSWGAEADQMVGDSVPFGKGVMAKHALRLCH
jgi:hypothetical protein